MRSRSGSGARPKLCATYCDTLLLTRDLASAYALTVSGIECLAQRFGNPPTDWQDWDKAAGWEKFIAKQQFSDQQAQALRSRLRSLSGPAIRKASRGKARLRCGAYDERLTP